MLITTRPHDDLTTCCRSIGKPTCPYDHYKVIDDAGHELPPCCIGNLVVKGPSIFTGYYDQPRENTIVFTADGYFRTGDLATIDSSGYITLCGRSKDTIKRGGESIFPAEIEKLIGAIRMWPLYRWWACRTRKWGSVSVPILQTGSNCAF